MRRKRRTLAAAAAAALMRSDCGMMRFGWVMDMLLTMSSERCKGVESAQVVSVRDEEDKFA